jgi:hypothetical protein
VRARTWNAPATSWLPRLHGCRSDDGMDARRRTPGSRPEQASAPAARTRPDPCGRSSAPVHRSHPDVVLEDLCANDLRDASGTIGGCLVRDDRSWPHLALRSRCRAILRYPRVSCRRQRFAGGRERGSRTSRRSEDHCDDGEGERQERDGRPDLMAAEPLAPQLLGVDLRLVGSGRNQPPLEGDEPGA